MNNIIRKRMRKQLREEISNGKADNLNEIRQKLGISATQGAVKEKGKVKILSFRNVLPLAGALALFLVSGVFLVLSTLGYHYKNRIDTGMLTSRINLYASYANPALFILSCSFSLLFLILTILLIARLCKISRH